MSAATTLPPLSALGQELDLSPSAFGELRRSDDVAGDADALRTRLAADGYLFLPGYLDRSLVLAARSVIAGKLAGEGHLDPDYPIDQLVARENSGLALPDLARDNAPLRKLLYDGPMITLYEQLLGGPVRHFDYTWMRAVAPGKATPPHCDIVYMGRGTTELYTAWTPLGDIPYSIGGLIVLENSHQHTRLRAGYGARDVDTFCENRGEVAREGLGRGAWGGWLTKNPVGLRARMGGRWLSAPFKAGDLLTFSMFTVHGSLDNRSRHIRLSSDTRYQRASDPVDERWVGENPTGHGMASKRGRVC